jgi:putative transposase
MSDYRRWYVPGGTYFFTVVAYRRRPMLCDELGRRCLREAIEAVQLDWPFDLIAVVLLPDHMHTVWTLPRGDERYAVRWKRIKEEFTRRYLDRGGIELGVTGIPRFLPTIALADASG